MKPARTRACAPRFLALSQIAVVKDALSILSFQSITSPGIPAEAARSSPPAFGLSEMTPTILHPNVSLVEASIRACRLVPPPDIRTAIGSLVGIAVHCRTSQPSGR